MGQLTKILFATALMVASALWGYSGDTFLENLASLKTRTISWFKSSEKPAPVETTPAQAASSESGIVAVSPQGNGANPFQQAAQNPYAQLMGGAKPAAGTLSKTLDSIRPGQVQETQKVQRNAYFEKLSEQLKQLQGENPPPPPAEPKAEQPEHVVEQGAVQANPFEAGNPTGRQPINNTYPPMPQPGAAYQPHEEDSAADEADDTDEPEQPDEPEE